MIHLGVNIDHVATLRQVRYAGEPTAAVPEPAVLDAARAAMQGGADSITLHVREDRRHMQEEDALCVRRDIPLPLNLEMGATESMLDVASRVRPDFVCLVPERRQEITTEGGLDVRAHRAQLRELVATLSAQGARVSMFIAPDSEQIRASAELGAPMIELHTGRFANAAGREQELELQRLIHAASLAHSLGLEVHAGHGIRLSHLRQIAQIQHLSELNIGHTIIARAVFVGLTQAVREMKNEIAQL